MNVQESTTILNGCTKKSGNLLKALRISNIFGLVGLFGISTIVGYLMPNHFYTYILDI